MGNTARYKMDVHIDLRDVDFNKKVKLSSIFSYFQDIASAASDDLGYGIEELQQKFNVAWVLNRIRVEIIRYPKWDEKVTIETWPLEPNRIQFERDYFVRDKEGNSIIKAVSSWLIMGLDDRKLKRSETIGIQYPEIIKERAIDYQLRKLQTPNQLELAYKKTIGYSDVDFNGHLNNSKYVDYIMDCFPVSDHEKYDVKAIEVNFMQEALPGDIITLYKDLSKFKDQIILIEGMNEEKNKIVFRAKVEIKEK